MKDVCYYVQDLKQKLNSTMNIVKQNLAEQQKRNNIYYDKKTKQGDIIVDGNVLLLLTTKVNRLLMHWRGPYRVIEKLH